MNEPRLQSSNLVSVEMRKHYRDQLLMAHGTGHYDGCWKDHFPCALEKALNEINRLAHALTQSAATVKELTHETSSSGWISVTDRNPPMTLLTPMGYPNPSAKRHPVLVATKDGRVFETIYNQLGFANLNFRTDYVTHWMALPSHPSVVETPATQKHYPEEWGPSDARQLTCVCGNPDPGHMTKLAVYRPNMEHDFSIVGMPLTKKELSVLDELCQQQDMSRQAVMKQALRIYQLVKETPGAMEAIHALRPHLGLG